MKEAEEWRSVTGFEGYYEVSSLGRVKSAQRLVWVSPSDFAPNGYHRKISPRFLKGGKVRSPTGKVRGLHVSLWKEHKVTLVTIHDLVLTAFVGPRPDGMYGCHKDDVPENNELSNLYWGTPAQNSADKIRNGNQPMGETISWSKLTENDVVAIREMAGTMPQSAIGKMFGVQQPQISRIVNRHEWRHIE